jgi:DNA-damage-inducible protein J
MPAKTAMIRARVDAGLKTRAEGILEELGLSASEAIRLFYAQVALRKGLPFDVAIPNAETQEAMRDVAERRDLTRFDNFDDFRKAMLGD